MDSYYHDRRVIAATRTNRLTLDESRMVLTFTLEDDDGVEDTHALPARFEVCTLCNGKGSHVNPSIDAHGITGEEGSTTVHTLKYAPTKVFQYVNGKGFCQLTVTQYIAHPPGAHTGSPIRSECWALEMKTSNGSSWQGFDRAPYINAELRMVIDITGREHDEVLRALPDCQVK